LRKDDTKILIFICLGSFFHIQSLGSINVSLAAIQRDLGASLTGIQWIGMIGVVMLSSLSLCFGRAGDILGRRKIFKIGLSLYAIGAGLATFAATFTQLLLSRLVMAVGLAMAAPMAAAIIASIFPPEKRAHALGVHASFMAFGRTTGPTIGGLILYFWGWRAVFFANCLFGVLTCVTLFTVLKGDEETRKEPFDFWGALFLMVGYPSGLIALTLGARSGWDSFEVVFFFALAAAGLFSFIWRELRTAVPLMKLGYFADFSLATTALALVCASLAQSPINIFGPLYMDNVLRLSPLTVGLLMAAVPLSNALSALFSGRLADRSSTGAVTAFGLALVFVGVLFYSWLGLDPGLSMILVSLALVGTGLGLFAPANQQSAFAAVKSQDYGVVSAMLSSLQTAAGSLGITLAVAFAEASAQARADREPADFWIDQQYAFSWLASVAAAAVLIALIANRRKS
jgi:MFS family permease